MLLEETFQLYGVVIQKNVLIVAIIVECCLYLKVSKCCIYNNTVKYIFTFYIYTYIAMEIATICCFRLGISKSLNLFPITYLWIWSNNKRIFLFIYFFFTKSDLKFSLSSAKPTFGSYLHF